MKPEELIKEDYELEKACNQFRDDDAYCEFPDYNPESNVEKIISNCGKGEVEKFETESGKGEAARAVLYFLLRYPRKIKEDRKNRINMEFMTNALGLRTFFSGFFVLATQDDKNIIDFLGVKEGKKIVTPA